MARHWRALRPPRMTPLLSRLLPRMTPAGQFWLVYLAVVIGAVSAAFYPYGG